MAFNFSDVILLFWLLMLYIGRCNGLFVSGYQKCTLIIDIEIINIT